MSQRLFSSAKVGAVLAKLTLRAEER